MKNNKFNINNKGFTLIELLVTISLIGIVVTLSVVTISTGIKKSKEKSLKVAKNSILSSSNNYLKENYSDKNWVEVSTNKKWDSAVEESPSEEDEKELVTCINIDQLISKGYLEKDFKTKNGDTDLGNIIYVFYTKNIERQTIIKTEFLREIEDDGEMKGKKAFCNVLAEKEVVETTPDFKDTISNTEPEPIPEPEPEPVAKESVPNAPDLTTGLIPVVYSGSNWVVADINSNWYDYDKQEWANGVSVISSSRNNYINNDGSYKSGVSISMSDILAMFVWIPRYSYTIGCYNGSSCLGYAYGNGNSSLSTTYPGAIDIKFEQGTASETLNGTYPIYTYSSSDTDEVRKSLRETHWYTHPAFTFGNQELTGIWVGKFEMSGTATEPKIKPDSYTLTGKNVKTFFNIARLFTTNSNYGLIGDAHMIKNEDWGAVAYLYQSKYGKYGNFAYGANYKEIFNNNSSSFITGRSEGNVGTSYSTSGTCLYNDTTDRGYGRGACGAGASTTGTIYGVYDMVGGTDDLVMANWQRTASVITGLLFKKDRNQSGFDDAWLQNSSNYKYYTYFADTLVNSNSMKGHALHEVNNWYGDILAGDDDPGSGDFDNLQRWLARGTNYDSPNKGVFTSASRSYVSSTYSSYIGTRVVLVNK